LRRALGHAFAAALALVLLPEAARAQVVVKANDTVAFRLGFLVQPSVDSLQDPVSQGYSQNLFLRRVRLLAAGSLAKDVSFFFETENSRLGSAGTSGVKNINTGFLVLDAFGEWRVFGNDQFILDLGKLVIPLSRNSLQSVSTALSLDAGTFTFQQVAGTQSDAGRDVGIQLKSYLADDHLEFRGGLFEGLRAPSDSRGAGSRNSPRWVGRLVYNFFDTEKGYIPFGTNLGKRKILAIGGGYDTQGTYGAYAGDFMIDWPIGPTDAVNGQNALTAHVDYIHFDGGCGLISAGTRATRCLIPTLTDQDEIFTDLGYYFVDLELQPFVRFEWNGFVDDIDHGKDSRRYMGGFNYYIAQQNFKVTGAYERIVPNAVGAATWKQKNTNHFVLQLQFFYF
jgi:phosphate-selective porin O/P